MTPEESLNFKTKLGGFLSLISYVLISLILYINLKVWYNGNILVTTNLLFQNPNCRFSFLLDVFDQV